MRGIIATLVLAAPITVFGATNTVGLELGSGRTSGLDCPSPAFNGCVTQDDVYRVYYGILPAGERVGARITHTELNDLPITETVDEIFSSPNIRSTIDDLSATYSYPVAKWVSITGKGGIARWEESRSAGVFFERAHHDGFSPALGLNIDFGDGWLRAGLSVDLYPSLGDAGNVRYYGAGVRFVW